MAIFIIISSFISVALLISWLYADISADIDIVRREIAMIITPSLFVVTMQLFTSALHHCSHLYVGICAICVKFCMFITILGRRARFVLLCGFVLFFCL